MPEITPMQRFYKWICDFKILF